MRTIMFWSVISRKLSLTMIVDVRAAGFDPFILLNWSNVVLIHRWLEVARERRGRNPECMATLNRSYLAAPAPVKL